MLLDGGLIHSKILSQNIDGHALGVSLDEVLHARWVQAPADPLWGSTFGRLGSRWDHFEEVPETFSLVGVVQVAPITSTRSPYYIVCPS
jgi:hypothetical protein